jgi:hypothetical protein
LRDFLKRASPAFTPEALHIVLQAFDDAWAVVERYDGITDSNRQALRLELAKRIVELSDMAEGDGEKLTTEALASLDLKKINGGAAP